MNFTKSLSKVILLTILSAILYTKIDKSIDGKWRDYPPLSYLNHPHADFHLNFEE